MRTISANKISAAEREDKLWSASEKYMRGEINVEELERTERRYAPKLFKESRKSSLLDLFKKRIAMLFA
ncbi:MAG TPA: hypothetical protein VK140_15175 [Ktedonobacteraceae bacterium]|nr:hypothetical protein [Ktedonobacteraceae bacterium]